MHEQDRILRRLAHEPFLYAMLVNWCTYPDALQERIKQAVYHEVLDAAASELANRKPEGQPRTVVFEFNETSTDSIERMKAQGWEFQEVVVEGKTLTLPKRMPYQCPRCGE